MVGSGFNYNATSFLSSVNRFGFWEQAKLVSDGAHRQYRINNSPRVLQQLARIHGQPGAGAFEVGVGSEREDRAAA